MIEPPIPADEPARLGALHALNVLDTPIEERFERITRTAIRTFDVPIALVSLVDADRQWFKSCQGLALSETPRSISFCGHAILQDQALVIPDTWLDPRFSDNPLVTGDPHIRFYAGQSLTTSDGSRVGTLCLIDRRPRDFSADDRRALRDLAYWAERELQTAQLKDALDAVQEAEQRYRTLVEQLPAITYVAALDAESSTIYTSPQIETMLGFSQAEWMADNDLWRKQIHPDDYERVMADIVVSHATGVPAPSEYRMLTRGGLPRWFRDQAVVVHDSAGQPLFMQGIMFDITERKLAEAALHASEARQRALLDAIPDSMFRLSRDGVYLDVRAETSHLALPPTMLLGKTLFDALPPDVARECLACIGQALQTGAVQFFEYQLMLEQTVRDFEARVVVCAENEVLTIVRDITNRKNIDRMKNEFISTVSHELRTPLTSICGALALIVGGVAGDIPPKARTMVEIASKNSERLIRLINDILDIDKIESGKMIFDLQPVELMPLLEHVIDINRAYGQQFNITFTLESAIAGAWVYADSDRLIQALTNLLSNAAKFSPAGARVLISLARHGDMLRIAIHDRGPGIPETFRERLFQKFAQADASSTRQKGGTGLGLSITKAIVEKLGGQIDVQIVPDVGSIFFIDLPEWYVLDLACA